MQTKPTVRNGKVSEYQTFVKENFQRVKRENAGASHGGVMEMLGRQYRERKMLKGDKEGKESDVNSIVRELEVITLDD